MRAPPDSRSWWWEEATRPSTPREPERPSAQAIGQRQPEPRGYAESHARIVRQQRQEIVTEHPCTGGGETDGQGALAGAVIIGKDDQPAADVDSGAVEAVVGFVLLQHCAIDIESEPTGQIDRVRIVQ